MKGMENSIFQLSKLEELLNILKNDSDDNIIKCYIDILKTFVENQSSVTIESEDILLIINEIIQILTKHVFEMQNIDSKNFYSELLILLSFLKLNFLKEDCIEYCNTAFSIVNNGIKLVKYFNDRDRNENAEYFCYKCKTLLKMLSTRNKITNEQYSIKNFSMEMQMTLDVYLIEALISSNKLNETLDEIQNIRQSISEFPNHKDYFFRLCYNAGVKLIKKEQFENAIVVLETAREIDNCADAIINIEISKFLAYIFSKYNPERNWNKCLDVLKAIPIQNMQVNCLTYMIIAAFMSSNVKIVEETLIQINEAPNTSMNLILKINDDLQIKNYDALAIEFLKNARDKKFGAPEKLYLMTLELMICFKCNYQQKANDVVESAIEMIKLHPEIKPNLVNGLCKEISSYSFDAFKSKSFSESLNWYKKCSRLLEATKTCDGFALQYIQQRMCLCYIELHELDSAKRLLAVLDPLSSSKDPFNLHLALQVAVVAEDEELADMALSHIGEDDASIQRILLSSCKAAFDSGNKRFLSKILETVLQKSNGSRDAFLHAKISQCLVRMHLDTAESIENLEKIINFIKQGLDSLQNCHQERITELAGFFSRVSWNLVLKPDIEIGARFQLSLLCCRFLELYRAPSSRLRNALVLAVASGLDLLKSHEEEVDPKDLTRTLLALIDKCRHLEADGCTIPAVMFVYEFETRLRANDHAAQITLRQMLQTPRVDACTLENVAAVAYEHNPVANHKLITTALRGSIQKALEQQNVHEVSRLYRSLLQVLFHNQEYGGGSEDENFEVCEGLINLMEDALKEYPQMEALWVMGKCWNWGMLSLASGTDRGRAEDWCSLALRCSRRLQGLEQIQGKKLTALYAAYFGGANQAPLKDDR